MANFMGQRVGTVLGKPYIAARVKTPMYPSVKVLQPSTHLRFLLVCPYGQLWSPYVRSRIRPTDPRVLAWETSRIDKTGTCFKLTCDPFIPDHSFKISGCLVVDLQNQEIGRALDFRLPCEVFAGEEVVFEWHVLCCS